MTDDKVYGFENAISIPVEDVGEDLLWEGDVKKVKIDSFWDAHGQKHYDNYKHPSTGIIIGKCHAKLICKHQLWCDSKIPIDTWILYINGKQYKNAIDIYSYKYLPKSGTLKVEAPYGQG